MPKLPRPCGKAGLTRKQAALDRLKVTEKQLSAVPPITKILKETPRGKHIALEAMQFSNDGVIQQFLNKYWRIPERDRASLSIEAIAVASKVDTVHLLGAIMLAMREYSVNKVKMIAVNAHPDVMKRRVEFAQLPAGYRDRDAIDTMLGALPSPQGPTFINKVFTGSRDEEKETNVREDLVDDVDMAFPDVAHLQERLQPLRQRLLEGKR